MNTLVKGVDDENVAKYISDFLRHPETTEELLGRGSLYFPMIEKELITQGLPDALKVLPLIESRFDPTAVSRVGAVGLWQIMIPTARELGLSITSYVDERRDPAKATRAALIYLQSLYERYEDWTLAFAAYNSGPGTVNRAIRHAGGRMDFESIKRFLPRETQKYIPRYIAAQYILEFHRDFGLSPRRQELDLQWTTTVSVSESIKISRIAELTGISEDMIMALNPGLKKNYVPKLEQGYDLILPKRVVLQFEQNLERETLVITGLEYRTIELRVKDRHSLEELAEMFDIDPYLFKSWNQLEGDIVEKGQQIVVHKLYDPNAAIERKIVPEPFYKSRSTFAPLPPLLDFRSSVSERHQVEMVRREEALNWHLHKVVQL